jgi:hypothetical protein
MGRGSLDHKISEMLTVMIVVWSRVPLLTTIVDHQRIPEHHCSWSLTQISETLTVMIVGWSRVPLLTTIVDHQRIPEHHCSWSLTL